MTEQREKAAAEPPLECAVRPHRFRIGREAGARSPGASSLSLILFVTDTRGRTVLVQPETHTVCRILACVTAGLKAPGTFGRSAAVADRIDISSAMAAMTSQNSASGFMAREW